MPRKTIQKNLAYDTERRLYYAVFREDGRRYTRTYHTREEAQAALEGRPYASRRLPGKDCSLRDWLLFWLEEVVARDRAESTLYAYRNMARCHVLPALIRRFHEAKEAKLPSVTCWGDGSPLREFLYVDDLANLCVFLMNHYSGNETVNAGTGKEISIKDLSELVAKITGYQGEILWDTSKPNGTPRKLLDVSKATALGWTYKTELEEGIRLAYQDFLHNPMRAER